MHQDVLSEKFCGEGIPVWASQPDETLPFPLPVQFHSYEKDAETGVVLGAVTILPTIVSDNLDECYTCKLCKKCSFSRLVLVVQFVSLVNSLSCKKMVSLMSCASEIVWFFACARLRQSSLK
eukprot:2322430-Amphidinium_carterae.1